MSQTIFPPFSVTAAAIRQLENLGGSARVDIEDGGCCGRTYVFSRDPRGEGDARYGCPGAELFVSAAAGPVLAGATLDYSDRIKPPRFRVIRNPNTPDRCPCNRSFGRAWPGRGQAECRSRCSMPWDTGRHE